MAIDILIELVPVAGLVLVAAVMIGWLHFKNRAMKAHLATCDYVLFEAEPNNMANIEADLKDCGWRLVDTRRTTTAALVCRFEKAGSHSRCLSEVFEWETSMPRTSRPQGGQPSLIKIKGHGPHGVVSRFDGQEGSRIGI